MNKKLTLVITSLALIGIVAVGGTLAWFTSKGEVKNVVTMGDVKITLTQPEFSKNANNTITNVMPGQEIKKDPTITNTSAKNPAYIRAKIVIDGDSLTPEQKTNITAALKYEIDTTNTWRKGSGDYYYYIANEGKLPAGKKVQLFDKVTVPGDQWKNSYSDLSFNINVAAEAVQVDNFTAFDYKALTPTWGTVTVE